MNLYDFLLKWAETDVEKNGLKDFCQGIAHAIPCACCPFESECYRTTDKKCWQFLSERLFVE